MWEFSFISPNYTEAGAITSPFKTPNIPSHYCTANQQHRGATFTTSNEIHTNAMMGLGFSQPSQMHSGSHTHNTWPKSICSCTPATHAFLTASTPGSHSRASDAQILKTISSWCNNWITKWQLELVPLRWSPEQRNLWCFVPGGTTGDWALFVQGVSSSQPPAWAAPSRAEPAASTAAAPRVICTKAFLSSHQDRSIFQSPHITKLA